MAALASIEENVSQFVAAMNDVRRGLRNDTTSTALQSDSNTTSANLGAAQVNDASKTPKAKSSTSAAAEMAESATTTTTDLRTRLQAELAAAERRTAYEVMQKEWLAWGESVMATIEDWLDRWDIGIADRVKLMGWADRLTWWGVKGSKKE